MRPPVVGFYKTLYAFGTPIYRSKSRLGFASRFPLSILSAELHVSVQSLGILGLHYTSGWERDLQKASRLSSSVVNPNKFSMNGLSLKNVVFMNCLTYVGIQRA